MAPAYRITENGWGKLWVCFLLNVYRNIFEMVQFLFLWLKFLNCLILLLNTNKRWPKNSNHNTIKYHSIQSYFSFTTWYRNCLSPVLPITLPHGSCKLMVLMMRRTLVVHWKIKVSFLCPKFMINSATIYSAHPCVLVQKEWLNEALTSFAEIQSHC